MTKELQMLKTEMDDRERLLCSAMVATSLGLCDEWGENLEPRIKESLRQFMVAIIEDSATRTNFRAALIDFGKAIDNDLYAAMAHWFAVFNISPAECGLVPNSAGGRLT